MKFLALVLVNLPIIAAGMFLGTPQVDAVQTNAALSNNQARRLAAALSETDVCVGTEHNFPTIQACLDRKAEMLNSLHHQLGENTRIVCYPLGGARMSGDMCTDLNSSVD